MRKKKRQVIEKELHTVLVLHALASAAVVSAGAGAVVVAMRLSKLMREAREMLQPAAEALKESLS